MSTGNHIKNVAIVGATGQSGSFLTKALLDAGKHNLTAIGRQGSSSKVPNGVQAKEIDYEKPATIVEALKGQDALVITLGVMAPPGTQEKLIDAAGEAGVQWIMPNDWSPDATDEGVQKDVSFFAGLVAIREYIKKVGKSSYLVVSHGFWYEYSLSIPDAYGFDLVNKRVTFFDDGNTKICTSTWDQCGRAVAAVLSLPVKADKGPSLDGFRNKVIYTNSFTVSQKDMLDSVLRVTGDKASDWKISHEPARERRDAAFKAMIGGDRSGFIKNMYTRIFYDDGNGDYEKKFGLSNEALGLPKDNLDEATKVAIQRANGSK